MSAERMGPAFDLLAAYDPEGGAFFERRGLGVATDGSVFDVAPEAAVARLRAHAPGSVGIGAIPFAGGNGIVRIAGRTVRRTDAGETWLVGGRGGFDRVAGASVPHDAFADAQLREVPSADTYAEAVVVAVARIRAGELRKVVLARTIEVEAGRRLDPRLLAHRLRAVNPDAYTFAFPTDRGPLVGASPELLVSRIGREVRSNPLAGSAPRSGDPEEDRANAEGLAASTKNREEHALVVDAIAETLRPFCEALTWGPEPVLLETPNVWHLSTRFRGVVRDPAPTVMDLVAALHPTPAVGGTPADAALSAIAELEPFGRGFYAGPVGWVDADGDGEWAIALRCALLEGGGAILYAGAGIVADSEPAAEVDETARKFRAFLDALRWG